MIRLAVADDEPIQAEYIAQLAQRWAEDRGIVLALNRYPSAQALLSAWEDGRAPEILLLDIQMPGMDGIALARTLRAHGDPVSLIFVTAYADYMDQGYDLEAVHYLLKPVRPDKLSTALDRAAARLARSTPRLLLVTDAGPVRLPLAEIAYVEIFAHEAVVHAGQTHRVRMPLRQLAQRLGPGFVRCHRAYLVNLDHIARIGRDALTLTGGEQLPLSRRRARAVADAFFDAFGGEDVP